MTVTVSFFQNFIADIGLKRMDLLNDTFKVILVHGYTFNGAHASLADVVSSQLPTSHGYTAGGAVIANKTWAYGSGVTKLDGDDVSWTATGGSIGPASGAIIYDDTVISPTADRLMCYIDFGSDKTAVTGIDLKIVFDSGGIMTID